jgi:hypothetical protein
VVECFYAVSFMLTVLYVECHKLTFYAQCRYSQCRGASANAD